MSWLQKIQTLPQQKKLAIIWTVVAVVLVLMIIAWILSARMQKNVAKDTTLFQTIGQGIHNVKENYGKQP
jgi:hypothetical protein